MITASYGEIRGCEVFGTQIVIDTLGNDQTGASGIIAVYPCAASDTTCLNGLLPHPVTGWQFYQPPYPGGVTILFMPSPNLLIIDDAGHQICFNLQSDTYDTNPSCAAAA